MGVSYSLTPLCAVAPDLATFQPPRHACKPDMFNHHHLNLSLRCASFHSSLPSPLKFPFTSHQAHLRRLMPQMHAASSCQPNATHDVHDTPPVPLFGTPCSPGSYHTAYSCIHSIFIRSLILLFVLDPSLVASLSSSTLAVGHRTSLSSFRPCDRRRALGYNILAAFNLDTVPFTCSSVPVYIPPHLTSAKETTSRGPLCAMQS